MYCIDYPSPYLQLTITGIREPVEHFRLFSLEPRDGVPVLYEAGQYLTLVGNTNDTEIRRSYSMISSPAIDEPLTIGVRRIPNGLFSRYLFSLRVGDPLLSSGTGGRFLLPDQIQPTQRFFFLTGGSGITPVFSMIRTLLTRFPHSSIVLIYSNHSPGRTALMSELQLWQERHEDFRIEWLFSTDPDLHRARLNPERLFRFLDEYNVMSGQSLFYLCGPEAYMRMCVFTLREFGIEEENIRRENFVVPSRPAARLLPPDQQPHEVILNIDGNLTAIKVQFPESILDAALRHRLPLAYSCKSGVCGNCAARCVSGAVWMSNNEVLTGKDLKEGLVLTCTGFPVYGDVFLKI